MTGQENRKKKKSVSTALRLGVLLACLWSMRGACAAQRPCVLPKIQFADEIDPLRHKTIQDDPFCLRVSRVTQEIEIVIHRHMEPQEIALLTNRAVMDYMHALRKRFMMTSAQGYSLEVHGYLDPNNLCPPECCTNSVMHLLCAIAGVENLGIGLLQVFNVMAADEKELVVQGERFFRMLAGAPRLVVETCRISNVSSYFFCALSHLLAIAPSPGACMDIVTVPRINFYTHPPTHPWNVEILRFEDVDELLLSPVVHPYREWKEEAVRGAPMEWRPGVQVGESLVVLWEGCELIVGHTLHEFVKYNVAVEIQTVYLTFLLKEQESLEDLAREIRAAILCLAALDSSLLWATLVLGDTYECGPGFKEDLEAAVKAVFRSTEATVWEREQHAKTRQLLLEIREMYELPCLLHVYVGSATPAAELCHTVPWAVQVPFVMLKSSKRIRALLHVLAPYMHNVHVAQAADTLKSMLKEGVSNDILTYLFSQPAQMTLLPCGCFMEKDWNETWHCVTTDPREFFQKHPKHFLSHPDHPPTIAVKYSKEEGVSVTVSPLVFGELPPLAPLAPGISLLTNTVVCSFDSARSCFTVRVQTVDSHLWSPLPIYYIEQVRRGAALAVKEAGRGARRACFRQVVFEVTDTIPNIVYPYLAMRALEALAEAGVSAKVLKVVHERTPMHHGVSPPYMRGIIAQTKRGSARARVPTGKLVVEVNGLEELCSVFWGVDIGTPRAPGVLSIVMLYHIGVRIRSDATGVLEMHAPGVEEQIAARGWHLKAISLACPHTPVTQTEEPFCVSPSCFSTVPQITVGGPSVFSSPAALGAFCEWWAAIPRDRGSARAVYRPMPGVAYVKDPEISKEGATARVQAYVETCWKHGSGIEKLVFYAADFEGLLENFARNHIIYLLPRATHPVRPFRRFWVYLRKHNLRLNTLAHTTGFRQIHIAVRERLRYTRLHVSTQDLGTEAELKTVVKAVLGERAGSHPMPWKRADSGELVLIPCSDCKQKILKEDGEDFDLAIGKCGHVFHRTCLDGSMVMLSTTDANSCCPLCNMVVQKNNGEVCVGRIQREPGNKNSASLFVVAPDTTVKEFSWTAVCYGKKT